MSEDVRRELPRSVVLFLLTFAACTVAYWYNFDGTWREALTFASALLGILLAHELGHYTVARMHGFRLSLPVFIPFPTLFGTAGAVIQLRSPPRSRQALLEMGAAGPIAGAVVAFVVLAASIGGVKPGPELPTGAAITIFNDPLVVKLLGTLVNGAPPDRYGSYPPGAWAAWVGCFVTGLNLLPIGQLDGGHVANALFPGRARTISRVAMVALAAAGLAWPGWWVWLVLLFLVRGGQPLPDVPREPRLPARALVIAVLVALLFGLTFMPTPIEVEVVA